MRGSRVGWCGWHALMLMLARVRARPRPYLRTDSQYCNRPCPWVGGLESRAARLHAGETVGQARLMVKPAPLQSPRAALALVRELTLIAALPAVTCGAHPPDAAGESASGTRLP